MQVASIVKLGTPSLRERSIEVAIDHFLSDDLKALIAQMQDAMKVYGGIGIAAPQIGVNKRVIVFGFDVSQRYPNEKPIPLTVLINPVVTPIGEDKVSYWEGCLSVPGLRGKVSRYHYVQYVGFDETGKRIERTADGLHARILQHEVDHLDGILFIDKLENTHDFGFEDALGDRLHVKQNSQPITA